MKPLARDTTRLGRRHLVEALIGGVALVAAWIVVAVTERVPAVEETIFRAVNGLPDWIEIVGWPVMQFGAFLAIPAVAIATWRVFRTRRVAIEVAIAGFGAWLAAIALKELVGRERPGAVLTDIRLRPVWEGLGFPSGHSAVAAAMATVIAVWAPTRWLPVIWGIPFVVGFMRLYTAAHFPLDVVAGWGLGVLIGTGIAWIGRRRAARVP